jgi:hypothetical protein
MSTHEQVWVKVNTTVDKGISPLITALSAFPKLQTVESCQKISNGWAWVLFTYGEEGEQNWEPLARFVFGFLGPEIVKELGDRVKISMEVNEAGLYRAEMAVQPAAIPATAKVLAKLSAKLKN